MMVILPWVDTYVAALAQTKESYSDDNALKEPLHGQLQAAIESLEVKKADVLLGIQCFFKINYTFKITFLYNFHVANSPAEPVWQAIHELVKNVSEAMLTPLPSFWKISKSFLDGRFRKVRLYLCSFPQATQAFSRPPNLPRVVAHHNVDQWLWTS